MIRTAALICASSIALAISSPALADDHSAAESAAIGDWGFDTNDLNQSVDPGDDFFAYVNGQALDATPIKPEHSLAGVVRDLIDDAEAKVHTIVEELAAGDHEAGSLEYKIGALYASYLDTDAINAAGLAPAQPYLSEIYAVSNREELAKLFAKPGMPSPFGGYVWIDTEDTERYVPYIGISGLGLPNRDYYLEDTEKNLEVREKYFTFLEQMLGFAGYQDPKSAAQAVYGFELEIAKAAWDSTLIREPIYRNNPMSLDELSALSDFPLRTYIEALGHDISDRHIVFEMPPTEDEIAKVGKEELIAKSGGGFPAFLEVLNTTPLATMQAWAAVNFLSSYAFVLPTEVDDANFAFNATALNGTEEKRERWKRALSATQSNVGEAIGKVYVERHFPARSKEMMDELVANLRAAMAANLETLEWMTPTTREAAKEKLDSFTVKIGYPEEFETYDGVPVSRDDPIGNLVAFSAWNLAEDVEKLTSEIDRGEWLMTPQTVNAYYAPAANEIVFPAAYLQPPMFDANADPAVNYGAVGATIGHEIGHGFDDGGSRYDGSGAVRNWWTDEDRAAFEKLGARLAAQYSKNCPFDDGETCHNGERSLGENIGDVGGLSMAYRAYRMSLNGEEAPVIDGLTGDQRFFIAYAQASRYKFREESARNQLKSGVHSLPPARVNEVVRNHDAWYEAFNVTEDDELYLPPEERVRIW